MENIDTKTLLDLTLDCLAEHDLSEEQVLWTGNEVAFTWEIFKQAAAKCKILGKDLWPIDPNIQIVGDTWWLEIREDGYNGSYWVYCKYPVRPPNPTAEAFETFLYDNYDR